MACVGEDNDGEGGEGGDGASPLEDADGAALGEGVAADEVCDDEDNEVGDGEEGNDGGVLEAVEATQEGEGDDDEPGFVSIYCFDSRPGRKT